MSPTQISVSQLVCALQVVKLTVLCKFTFHYKHVRHTAKVYSKRVFVVNLAVIMSYDYQICNHCCIFSAAYLRILGPKQAKMQCA